MTAANANTPNNFNQSIIWDWQAHYYQEKGVEAWKNKEVPHYVTSNPTIANTYAQLFWTFRKDRIQQKGTDALAPIVICELGAGSGAFGFHFIQRMITLCEYFGEKPSAVFKYILTDISKKTIDFWLHHPRFQNWFQEGILDVAYVDALSNSEIALQVSKETLLADTLEEPLILIGNYFFDSIPQHMFRIEGDQLATCQVTCAFPEESENLDEAEKLGSFQPQYVYQATEQPFSDPLLSKLLQEYQTQLADTHLLFPEEGWKVIQRLKALSKSGVFVLGTDKGTIALEQLERHPVPEIQQHGSISMPVNIHALARLTETAGGKALLPTTPIWDFNIFGLLLTNTSDYPLLSATYTKSITENNPYDFYQTANKRREKIHLFAFEDILAYAKLSRYDVHQFVFFLPKLMKEASLLSRNDRQALQETLDKVWEAHYSLGEALDVAYHFGNLLYELQDYKKALEYFQYSIDEYGRKASTMYNKAVCYRLLKEPEQAIPLLEALLQENPENREAKQLLAVCLSERFTK